MSIRPNPAVATWIEQGLTDPKVLAIDCWFYPIEARAIDPYTQRETGFVNTGRPEHIIEGQWYIGGMVPLTRLMVNVLGAAFVGKVGSADAAWNLYKEQGAFDMLDETANGITLAFSDFLGLTYDEARYLRRKYFDGISILEIATLVRNGEL